MKIVDTVEHRSWRVTQVESDHFHQYFIEQKVGEVWSLLHWQSVTKPEFLAAASLVQGKALAEAAAAVTAAQVPKPPELPCSECEGKGRPLPGCWKCERVKP